MPQTRSDDVLLQDQLETLARQTANVGVPTRPASRLPSLLDRLQEQEKVLRAAYQYFAQASEVQLAISYAAEWLLDNFYLVEQALRQIREHMPVGYYRQLPKLESTSLEGYPRVYALARKIIEYYENQLDIDRVTSSVRSYQRVTPLTMGELWALPTMLRIGTLENLKQAVASITRPREKESAGDAGVFGRSLAQGLEDEAVVASCIQSLRMLATQDWKTFFEGVSLVERVLCSDPADTYPRMDFSTRDRYRGVVEDLALATGLDEEKVAQEAVRLAKEAQTAHLGKKRPRTTHIGFYLIDAGRAQLEERLGCRPSLSRRLSRWLLGHPMLVYLGGVSLFTLAFLSILLGYAWSMGGSLGQMVGVGLLTISPTLAVAVNLLNWIITRTVPPRLLPRLDFQKGIPSRYPTMVSIPALLTDRKEVAFLLDQLELHYLGNTDLHLYFALLADFSDAPRKHMPDDDALLEQATEGVRALNRKYGRDGVGPFYLFHREREWNPSEDCWMGWERKRGKLADFNRLIGGEESSFTVQIGDLDILSEIRYVITLDADTLLPREGARRLVATLAHPLNQAEFDSQTGEVIAGYTVLQPRVEIKPTSAGHSRFAQIFSGDVGLDLYTHAVSDVYQDLFGEGIYAGKGIYDVAAFERSLEGRVPNNALLSHDLFEGVHGRAGLVTDVVLYEDYPAHYLAHTHRLHRWVRGDWQLIPWLFPRVPHAGKGTIPNTLSVIDRWKILDNLRRSLLGPTLLALLIAGWLWLPGSTLVWTLAGFLAVAVIVFSSLFSVFRETMRGMSLKGAVHSVWLATLRWLLAFVFLPYESLIALDAIAATLHRLLFSRKRLLQWTTAAHTVRLFGRTVRVGILWRQMGPAVVIAFLLDVLVVLLNPAAIVVAAPLLLLWMISPLIAYWISRPVVREQERLSEEQCRELRGLARRMWLYFEQFIGPDDQWLPPDHFQENPLGLVAHRTSPTNIGLLLLSTLASYDMGYIGPLDLVLRLRPTLETMNKLERHRGHFLNWYDTRSLHPLPPRYVSAVDSGNLAACLLALRQGCFAMSETPILRWQRWQGLFDTLYVLRKTVEDVKGEPGVETIVTALRDYLMDVCERVLAVRDTPDAWVPLLAELVDEGWQELERLLISLVEEGARVLEAETLHGLRIWSERVSAQLLSMQSEVDILLPWLLPMSDLPALLARRHIGDADIAAAWRALVDILPVMPRLEEVPGICRKARARVGELQALLADRRALAEKPSEGPVQKSAEQLQEAYDWCVRLGEELYSAQMAAESLLIGLSDLGAQAETYFQAMDFRFLFDSYRQVFHIGYNVEVGALDGNYYDLLASEARIASLLAIGKGDVPQSHWLHLSRPVTRVDGTRALLSWGGTMFEYLMPALLLHTYEGTLLDETTRAAVDHQITYGHQQGVPWGISESGYYRFDAGMHYQYRGFGVPGLGFKRDLGEDLVIAPYASLLAMPIRPQAVMRNVERLVGEQMLGRYGLYEAIDYTRSRLSKGQKSAIVRSYMVHHQGMALLALTNYLYDDVMVRRTHADPRVQSIQLLLQEQVPRRAPVEIPHPEEAHAVRRAEPLVALSPWNAPVDAPMPHVHVLSNGRYNTLVTSTGGGYSFWRDTALTRWRADTTLDCWGTWIYVQDRDSGELRSATYQPVGTSPESQETLFFAHKIEFGRRDRDISLWLEVTVPPDDDVEVRRITLVNHGDRTRRLALTSYGEVVLAPQGNDQRHQAFHKLFVESEYLSDLNGLLFRRRPRSQEEEPVYLIHMLVVGDNQEATGAYEADRARFLGRGRTPRFPIALENDEEGGWLSGTTGATLDPIMALGQNVELRPHARAELAYITLAGGSLQEVKELALRYRAWPRITRAFSLAHTSSELELHRLNLSTLQLEHIQRLLSVLLYPHAALRAAPATLAANSKGQPGLWPHAISGDYPILLVRVGEQEGIELLREVLQAHIYWRNRGLQIDLVILNERESGYDQELQGQIHRLITHMDSDAWLNRRGGIFILRSDQIGDADRVLLATAARVILNGEDGPLAEQLGRLQEQPVRLPRFIPSPSSPMPSPELEGVTSSKDGGDIDEPAFVLARPQDLLFDNGLGGFSPDGREYVMYLEAGQSTPAPWINVIANPGFGFLVSETGSGYTWAENSGENKLTPWRNDPVSDTPGEALYLRDEETAQVWSPTPLPAPAPSPYLVRHGAGYSVFEHYSHGLKQRLRLFAVRDAPVKVVQLRLENTRSQGRRITVTFYAEWVLGTTRDATQQYVVPEFDAAGKALLATNAYNEEFGERVAFVASNRDPHGLTADRTEFLGRNGRYKRPAALDRIGLAGMVRAGLDPCAALQVHLDIEAGGVQEVFFLLGQGADRREALRLVKQYRDPKRVAAAWEDATEFWDDLLSSVTVRTPDPAMDLLLNRWLLYQALSCRVWGRSALYQSSGAFGYRDQLQDVMALAHAAPGIARDHIVEVARHQFEAGDVLHWWHPPSGRGVRTRYTDDLLWLPFATAHYVGVTGDAKILEESTPFVKGEPLSPEEVERYGQYASGKKGFSLYEHCRRALDKGTTAGPHGIPLMGGGDWNDGMNRVGIGGSGESVWLGWFLYATLTRFADLCERMDDGKQAAAYRKRAAALRQALEDNAWDWGWYRRAYYDDGTPLGSSENDECQLDAIAQSWAVLSEAADRKRAAQAMAAVARRLVREDDRLILLFTPPFDKTERDPGYIKGYPPGIRENGGQYTHAAIWTVWAFAELGQGDRAEELFRVLNPIYHSDTPEKAARYRVEPYVVAADVYSVPPHVGRGGWTWYTGSAGWMYRLGTEAILGLCKVGIDQDHQVLRITPCIPRNWSSYEITYRHGETTYMISVENPDSVNCGVKQVALDGVVLPGDEVPLVDDGKEHTVRVLMMGRRYL
ncbi:MAG: GH36-type glycosyl hydrolase domain-containing protein [Anaerolineae bacterium]